MAQRLAPASSHLLKVSTSMVLMFVLLFYFRLVVLELASQEVLVRVGERCTRWSAAKPRPHRQRRSRDRDNRRRFPCPGAPQTGAPPVPRPGWTAPGASVPPDILQQVVHRARSPGLCV